MQGHLTCTGYRIPCPEGVIVSESNIAQLSVNTIRTLSIDAVQQANSGHPGAPMGLASIASS